MRVLNNAEGQADETTVSAANSGGSSGDAFTSVNIGTGAEAKTDTAHAAHGTKSYRIATTGTSSTVWLEWDIAAGITTIYGRILIYLTGTPAVSIGILRIMDSGGTNQIARIQIRATERAIEVRNAANTIVATGTTPLTINAFVTLEFKVISHASAGEVTCRLHNTMDSASVTETISATGQNTGGGDIRVARIGVTGATLNQGPFWIDDLDFNDIGLPGPALVDKSSSDTGSGADAATLEASPTAADTGSGADAATLVGSPSSSDTGSGADAGTLVASPSASDTGSGADVGALVASITSPDSAVGADAGSLVTSIGAADTGAGVDAGVVVAAIAASETGAGADALSVLAAALSDTQLGTGVDAATLLASLLDSDTGTGVDEGTNAQSVSDSDSGSGVDAFASLVAAVSADETGSGADDLSTLEAELIDFDSGVGDDEGGVALDISDSDSAVAQDAAVIEAAVADFENAVLVITEAETIVQSAAGPHEWHASTGTEWDSEDGDEWPVPSTLSDGWEGTS